MKTRFGLGAVLLLVGLAAWGSAGTIQKKYPDGALKLKYAINETGDKEGSYEEFFPDGKTKVKANFKADKRDGAYQTFHANGKPHVTATYKDGQLTGTYSEHNDDGLPKLTATYKDGKLDGTLTQFDKGKPVATQVYKDGRIGGVKTIEEVKKVIGDILGAPLKEGTDRELEEAFRILKVYRFLADVPYDNLILDDQMNKGATAAAAICSKLGRLDHNPPNPGLPEAEYQLAKTGAAKSNLAAFNGQRLRTSVDGWMFDSDPRNIQMLGHRRWMINPSMMKVGFGKAGNFSACWCQDTSQKNVPDFDYICFPPRGPMPVELIGPAHAWNISLNPRKFKPPPADVQPMVFPVDERLAKVGDALPLNFNKVDNGGYGLPHCMIFRPDKLAVAAGTRYLVEINGLTRADGKPAPTLSYVVEFVTVR